MQKEIDFRRSLKNNFISINLINLLRPHNDKHEKMTARAGAYTQLVFEVCLQILELHVWLKLFRENALEFRLGIKSIYDGTTCEQLC